MPLRVHATRCTPLAILVALLLAGCGGGGPPTSPVGDIAAPPVGAVRRWSDPASWPAGQVPQAGDTVVIPAGETRLLDTSTPALGGIRVRGLLTVEDRNLELRTRHILVESGGELRLGTADAPLTRKVVVTLFGGDPAENLGGMGTKVLGVSGGTLRIHGASRAKRSWTRLAATAAAGATTLSLVDPVDWAAGDTIVVAPTGFAVDEAERVVVTAVSGRTVTVQPALAFRHAGETRTVAGVTVEQRAEVGLLTRNVVIRGDDAQAATGFGAHIIVMPNSRAYVEGAELRQMGQRSRLGRYAFHWHFTGTVDGQYFRHNSVHRTFTRAVVVHQTNGALVRDNVGYESNSHMYVWAEDGPEERNVLEGNLGVLVKILPREQRIFSAKTQDENRPSVFWGMNASNTLRGNAAAAYEAGAGYFYDGHPRDRQPAVVFEDNAAHTGWRREPAGLDALYPPETVGFGLFINGLQPHAQGAPLRFGKLTAWKNAAAGAWLETPAEVLDEAVLADNAIGVAMFAGTVRRTLVTGQTGITPETPPRINGSNGGIHLREGRLDKRPILDQVTFVGVPDGAVTLEDHSVWPGTRFDRLRLENTVPLRVATRFRGRLDDSTGGLLGTPRSHWFGAAQAFAHRGRCTPHGTLPLVRCDDTVPTAFLVADVDDAPLGAMIGGATVRREADGITVPMDGFDGQRIGEWLAPGEGYAITYNTTRLPLVAALVLEGAPAGAWVDVSVPVAAAPFVYRSTSRAASVADAARALVPATTLDEARAAPGGRYWLDGAGRLHLRLTPSERILVCERALCAR